MIPNHAYTVLLLLFQYGSNTRHDPFGRKSLQVCISLRQHYASISLSGLFYSHLTKLLRSSKLFHMTNFPIKNCMPKDFQSIMSVRVIPVVPRSFENPFHCLGFGLTQIFIKHETQQFLSQSGVDVPVTLRSSYFRMSEYSFGFLECHSLCLNLKFQPHKYILVVV